jgi:hypothetical protein
MTEDQKKQITEYLQKINEILEDKPKEPKSTDKVFRVKCGVKYWYVNDSFEIDYNQEMDDVDDDFKYVSGNYFNTKEQAILYRDQLNEWLKLKSIADGDIHSLDRSFMLCYSRKDAKLVITDWIDLFFGPPIFATKESAKKALENVNHELIIGYMKRGL